MRQSQSLASGSLHDARLFSVHDLMGPPDVGTLTVCATAHQSMLASGYRSGLLLAQRLTGFCFVFSHHSGNPSGGG